MAEMLPTWQAANLVKGLTDYLTTTFALSDKRAQQSIAEFLTDSDTGMFKGPYIRLRLPFEPAAEGWQDSLDYYGATFPPYGHQARAFQCLTSKAQIDSPDETFRRPAATLVTTGTGSGKTEAFLYPILDHVLRAQKAGITGVKALILYPMNALANDQAGRLAETIAQSPELGGVRAALYTGQQNGSSTRVTSRGLITDRADIRKNPPDILLTNYKMLDMLLLRHEDAKIWSDSATSLQYLVLDEFHTYDGAQGTDVAMLLRRLGATLKSYWPDDLQEIKHAPTEEDRARPLGRITPVATSATLGGGAGGAESMLQFAETIFGEPLSSDALVTESRMSLEMWKAQRDRPPSIQPRLIQDLAAEIKPTNQAATNASHTELLEAVKSALFFSPLAQDDSDLLSALRHHPLTDWLVTRTEVAAEINELSDELFPSLGAEDASSGAEFLSHVLALYSHARAIGDRQELTVETHLWVRELSRIEAALDVENTYRWGDDGVSDSDIEQGRVYLPAIFCRHCGRNGWGAKLAPTETELDLDADAIRQASLQRDSSFRPLLEAAAEADSVISGRKDRLDAKLEGLRFFHTIHRTLSAEFPEDSDEDFREGRIIPVQTHVGLEAGDLARDDVCPACLTPDAIRFVGSAIATLTSVAVSNLFGAAELDTAEKKALIFTDSVQDAAHRAGFIQARSHTFNLRTALRASLEEDQLVSLNELVDAAMQVPKSSPHARFRLVPPELTEREGFQEFWDAKAETSKQASARRNIRRRLAFDAAMEFGLQGRLGRTLELTGSVVAEVDAGSEASMLATAQRVWDAKLHVLPGIGLPSTNNYLQWVRGVLVRMRLQGGLHHEWLDSYISHEGHRYHVWGGRRRNQGMPAFPKGRPAPAFPAIGPIKPDSGLDPVTPKSSWYSQWTARTLGVGGDDAGFLVRELFEDLARQGVISEHLTEAGARVYSLPTERIMLLAATDESLAAGALTLVCSTCSTRSFGTPVVIAQLSGAPCLHSRCAGRLESAPFNPDNFYRRMYKSADSRRVVSREHTSLLEDKRRLAYEEAFKSSDQAPDAPNVLVATPTLEMGIDIGDLSCVMLASMPGSVASYVQRVGRAGRLTGNSLVLAFVRGRGEHLPKLYDPLSVINGQVRPPTTYLEAEEILTRQFAAFLGDRLAQDGHAPHPRSAREALKSIEPETYLGEMLALMEARGSELLEQFLSQFSVEQVQGASRDRLRSWAFEQLPPIVGEVSRRWQQDQDDLHRRIQDVEEALGDLKAERTRRLHDHAHDAEHPKVAEAERDVRAAESQLRRLNRDAQEARTEYWISKIESYGLFPNYTLIGDAVDLDVGISWRNEDSQFEATTETFSRGAGIAIQELVPGSTFYAQGLEIAIDAVDMGPDLREVQYWQICPHCGWKLAVHRISEDPVRYSGPVNSCGRCSRRTIEDVGNVHAVVVLRKVSAEIRRDEAAISDSREDRKRTGFDIVTLADVDPDRIETRWFVETTGFGAEYVRAVDLTWLNLGERGRGGATLMINGEERTAPRFALCEYCGKQDRNTRSNTRDEHRFWCRHRNGEKEHTRNVLLARELSTQGVKIHLPAAVSDVDEFSLPTLKAALLMGLREHVGGTPGHLGIMTVLDLNAEDDRPALLLHDTVPGGTGYLAAFKDPWVVFEVLKSALLRVRSCSCEEKGRRACHECLLPYADRGAEDRVSRVAAERLLRELLGMGESEFADGGIGPDRALWKIVEHPVKVQSGESALEMKFRRLLKERLAAVNADVHAQPGPRGERLRIEMPNRSRWTLEPQVDVVGCRPDFVLTHEDPNIPRLAIFTDGRAYHADPRVNRVGDDAVKRFGLTLSGHIPWAITDRDVELFESADSTETRRPAPWVNPKVLPKMLQAHSLPRELLAALPGGSMELLWEWMQNPDVQGWRQLSGLVMGLTLGDYRSGSASDAELPDYQFAKEMVVDSVVKGPVWWTRRTPFLHVLAAGHPLTTKTGISAVMVLDDRAEAVGDPEFAESWRSWLFWSNLTAFREDPKSVLIGTASVREEILDQAGLLRRSPGLGADLAAMGEPRVPILWQPVVDEAADGEDELAFVKALIAADVTLPSTWGDEISGIPIHLAWTAEKIAVVYDAADGEELHAEGWRVVELGDVQTVVNAHQNHAAGRA